MSYHDLNSAMAYLATLHHYTVKTVNDGSRKAHECKIWSGGKRVVAQRSSPLDAINAALAKLSQKTSPRLKLTKEPDHA